MLCVLKSSISVFDEFIFDKKHDENQQGYQCERKEE
jgi:hypothetical protein